VAQIVGTVIVLIIAVGMTIYASQLPTSPQLPTTSSNSPCQATIFANPQSGYAPLIVTFTSSVTPPDGSYALWWDFGAGSSQTYSTNGAPVNYTYVTNGTFVVQLTVQPQYSQQQGCAAATTVVVQ
jgi:PKD repeat protein